VALGVTEFWADGFTEVPEAITEFTVSTPRPAIEHTARLNQIARWAQANLHSFGMKSAIVSGADVGGYNVVSLPRHALIRLMSFYVFLP
jgi:hypothetical protein